MAIKANINKSKGWKVKRSKSWGLVILNAVKNLSVIIEILRFTQNDRCQETEVFEKLSEVEDKYVALEERLADPDIVKDMQEYQRVAKSHSDLTQVVTKWREYKSVRLQLANTEEMLRERLDEDLRELAQLELTELRDKIVIL